MSYIYILDTSSSISTEYIRDPEFRPVSFIYLIIIL